MRAEYLFFYESVRLFDMNLKPEPAPPETKNPLRKINPANWRVVSLVLTVKFIILAYGLYAHQLLSNQKLDGAYWILGIWNRWDAESYMDIARYGYTAVGERRFNLVFFPLYPALTALVATVTGEEVYAAFLVSGAASVALGLGFYHLVRLDYSSKTALAAVWFMFIFPTAYFLHIPYTESLFLALVVGSFLCARQRRWLLAGVLGFFACTTRLNGLILCLAFVFEIRLDWRETRRFDPRWLWLGLVPLGFAAYLGLNYAVAGNAFVFLEYQRENWGKYVTFPWTSLVNKVTDVYNHTDPSPKMEGLQELIFVWIGFFSTIVGWRYLRDSYRAWMAANWLLFVSTSWILSVPRYTLTMFPLFILIALAARRRAANFFITVWSILFLALFIASFVQRRWAF